MNRRELLKTAIGICGLGVLPGVAPAATPAPQRVLTNEEYRRRVFAMLRERKRDPASWQTLPFPVKYQTLEG